MPNSQNNKITKKMIAGIKRSDGFLIPNYEEGSGFLSIKNGKKLDVGMVVYTGVDLNGNSIISKIRKFGTLNYSWTGDQDLFDSYLKKVKSLKITKQYSLTIIEGDLQFEMN
jgi:hypothetical protein